MAVGTQIERQTARIAVGPWRSRRWIAAMAIALAGIGTGAFFAVRASGEAIGTPVKSSPVVEYSDPGVEARQEALRRFHEDARPPLDDQAALKKYHQDAKG